MEAKSMKKLLPVFVALSLGAVVLQAKTPPKPANFAGNWVLDTSQTKNLPQGLESYNMVVTQDTQQLKVKTTLKGDLRPTPNLNGSYPQGGQGTGYPGGYPGRMGGGMGRMGGMGMPMGGMGGPMGEGMPVGMPGSGGGRPRMGRQSTGTAAAFTNYPQTAAYKLDGSESTAQLGDPSHSDATSKAAWAKGNKELKLSLTGSDSSNSGGGINLKEQWKLSKDGQHLLVDRTLHSPSGSKTVHLVFDKQPASSAQPGTQGQKG
jgi:hypothetical protein